MKVKVYSTSSCPWCQKLEEWLKNKSIDFEIIDVGVDESAQKEMITKSGQMGVPQIEINGKMIVGFDPDAILDALDNVDNEEDIRTSEEE